MDHGFGHVPNARPQSLQGKRVVPLWLKSILRHLLFSGTKMGPSFSESPKSCSHVFVSLGFAVYITMNLKEQVNRVSQALSCRIGSIDRIDRKGREPRRESPKTGAPF